MRNHLTESEVKAYRTRTTSPEQFVDISDHIFICDQCFQLVDSPQKVRAAYDAIKKFLNGEGPYWTEHLDYEQLAGYTNGTLGEEAKSDVLAHVEHCLECDNELKDFTKLKAQCNLDRAKGAEPPKRKSLNALIKNTVDGRVVGLAVFLLVTSLLGLIYLSRNKARVASLENDVTRLTREIEDLKRQPQVFRLALNDGGRHIAIDAKEDLLGLEELPATYRSAARDALTTGRVPMPSVPQTSLGKIGIRLGPTAQERSSDLLYPVATAVQGTRPEFEWQALRGARSFRVLMKDLATGEESEGKQTTMTTWVADKELARGHQYAWMVETRIGGRLVRIPSSDKAFAAFRVLDVQQAEEVKKVRASWGDSHLVMGLVYAKAGLMREAEKEFSELAAANPDSSTVKRLLEGVQKAKNGGHRQE